MMKSLSKKLAIVLLVILLPLCALAAEVYFSPKGGAQDRIIELIDGAKQGVDVAMYGLTSPELAQALLRARDRGVKVRVVLDRSQAAGRSSQSGFLKANSLDVRIDRGRGIMHHKVGIIDKNTLITGSYNWTTSAENVNRENCLILTTADNPKLIEQYENRFEQLWNSNEEKAGRKR